MIVRAFVDTNVLMYAAAGRRSDPHKYARALDILQGDGLGLSGQVLGEFYANAIRKPAIPLTPEEAFAWVRQLEELPCAAVDSKLAVTAIRLSQRYQISYWDGAIVAAAERLGAQTLYTEDLNHDQIYGSVRVENPFLNA